MTSKLAALVLFSTLSFSAIASTIGVDLNVDLKSQENYQLQSNKFVKIYDVAAGNVSVKITVDDTEVVNATEPVSERENATGEVSIEVLDNNYVRLIDNALTEGRRNNINQIVKAEIKKSFTGKIKSIKISQDDYLAVYKEVLERVGMSKLSQLNIQDENARISTSIDVSGLSCEVEKTAMTCQVNVKMNIGISAQD
ncbi:MAG: hypothetical protein Fur0010_15530 [Bdellovibrio sp.]